MSMRSLIVVFVISLFSPFFVCASDALHDVNMEGTYFFVYHQDAKKAAVCWYDMIGYGFHNLSLGCVKEDLAEDFFKISFAVPGSGDSEISLVFSHGVGDVCWCFTRLGNTEFPCSQEGRLAIAVVPIGFVLGHIYTIEQATLALQMHLFRNRFPSTMIGDIAVSLALQYLIDESWDKAVLYASNGSAASLDFTWHECKRLAFSAAQGAEKEAYKNVVQKISSVGMSLVDSPALTGDGTPVLRRMNPSPTRLDASRSPVNLFPPADADNGELSPVDLGASATDHAIESDEQDRSENPALGYESDRECWF